MSKMLSLGKQSILHSAIIKGTLKMGVLNALPNKTILDLLSLEAFAQEEGNVVQIVVVIFDMVENMREGNAGYHNFLFFMCFPDSQGIKLGIMCLTYKSVTKKQMNTCMAEI